MKSRQNIGSEFLAFLKQNKKYWLLPMVLVMLLFSILVFFSGSALTPFIYTLF